MEDLLLSFARDLDDAYPNYEFSIWSREQLLRYFNEALCLIAAYRPDLFIETKVIKIDPCSPFLDTCGCMKIIEVLGQSDKHGNHIRPIPRRTAKGNAWQGKRRGHKGRSVSDQLTEFDIIDVNGVVRVYPDSLDPTADIYVAVRCVVEPKHYELDDEAPNERCAYLAAARHWVLYNAKMIDGEFSQALHTTAREHREMFTGLLGLIKESDKQYEKELRDLPDPRKR